MGDDFYPTTGAPAVRSNGMNAEFGQMLHCVASEPHATFVRITLLEGTNEVAFESAVLGRLRCGYRVLQLRDLLGCKIELCYLFVHITWGSELNFWCSARQLRVASMEHGKESARLQNMLSELSQERDSCRISTMQTRNSSWAPSGTEAPVGMADLPSNSASEVHFRPEIVGSTRCSNDWA